MRLLIWGGIKYFSFAMKAVRINNIIAKMHPGIIEIIAFFTLFNNFQYYFNYLFTIKPELIYV